MWEDKTYVAEIKFQTFRETLKVWSQWLAFSNALPLKEGVDQIIRNWCELRWFLTAFLTQVSKIREEGHFHYIKQQKQFKPASPNSSSKKTSKPSKQFIWYDVSEIKMWCLHLLLSTFLSQEFCNFTEFVSSTTTKYFSYGPLNFCRIVEREGYQWLLPKYECYRKGLFCHFKKLHSKVFELEDFCGINDHCALTLLDMSPFKEPQTIVCLRSSKVEPII